MDATDRKHVNSSWGDTVKCRLDAGKSPIFRSQSPCTYIYTYRSRNGFGISYVYGYLSEKVTYWLFKIFEIQKGSTFSFNDFLCLCTIVVNIAIRIRA